MAPESGANECTNEGTTVEAPPPEHKEAKPAVVHEEIVIHEDALDASFHAASRSIDQLLWQGSAEVAKAVTLLGPGIIVLPMFGRVSGVDDKKCLTYESHPKRASRAGLMDRIDFENKFGQLDPGRLMQELAGGKHGLDARMKTLSDEDLQDEVAALQDWQKKANGRMKTLEKRAAYAFIGMRAGTVDKGAIKRAFRRKALELHPDKGGDAERFQLLQEMKDLLIEPTKNELEDKEDDKEKKETGPDKKDKDKEKDKSHDKEDEKDEKENEDETFEDTDFSDDEYDVNEEFRKMFPKEKKRKKKKQDDDDWGDLGKGEDFNRDKHVAARRKLHRHMLEMWERAGKLAEEINRSQTSDSGGEALRTLRKFVDRFANVEISKLKENDPKKAERIFRRFLEQGSEIVCAAGAVDAVATVSCIAMQVNYPLLAKAPSSDLQAKTSALIDAIKILPGVFEKHVGPVEDLLGNRRQAAKEAATAAVKLRVVMPDLTIMVKRGEKEMPGVRTADIEMPPGSTVADLRAAALQVFGRAVARLFCGGRFLGSEKMPLATIEELQAGAPVQCLPSNRVIPASAVAAAQRSTGATSLPTTTKSPLAPESAGASASAAADGEASTQAPANPHALPEGNLGYPIDASASLRRGGSAAKATCKEAEVMQNMDAQDGGATAKVPDANESDAKTAESANTVVAVEIEKDVKIGNSQRRAAEVQQEEKTEREEEYADKAREASQDAQEARAREEVEQKAAEKNDETKEAEDGEDEGEDDWFDDFFDSAKKAADDKAALEKAEAEKREAAEKKRREEFEIAEAKRRAEEKMQKKELQEKGLSAMQQRLQAQKQAAEAKKKLEAEKKKALDAKKQADEEKRRVEEARKKAEQDRLKAEEEARKKQETVKCRDLVIGKEEPTQDLQQVRTEWDQNWEAPSCAGGRRADGLAIFCHPCDCWVPLKAPFDHSCFDRHCQEKDFHYNWID